MTVFSYHNHSFFQRKENTHSLLYALVRVRLPEIFVFTFLKFASEGLLFANPMLLKELLGFIENSRCYPEQYPYFISFLLFVIAFLQSAAYEHFINNNTRVSWHYRTACMGLISRKSLRIVSINQQQNAQESTAALPGQVKAKKGGAGIGKVATLMSNDCEKIRLASATYLNVLWLPLSIIINMSLLYSVIGPASFVGIGFSMILIPVQTCVGKSLARVRKRGREASDQRVGLMHELITGIRIIKLLAWEVPLAKKVRDVVCTFTQ